MAVIKSIAWRRILNSHVEFTNEFIVELQDGALGLGASPRGETISVYENEKELSSAQAIISELEREGCLGREMEQTDFDECLQRNVPEFGRNNTYALSLAFFNATNALRPALEPLGWSAVLPTIPRLCCNLLNGGWHAYTNPVLSDFAEFILVARTDHVEDVIQSYNAIQLRVREELNRRPFRVIAGNPVRCFGTADNRECIDFLLKIRDDLSLEGDFDLMIDASAGDLWTKNGYLLAITDNALYSREQFRDYWLRLMRDYGLRFLEDPLREQDAAGWRELAGAAQGCCIIADNFYSSDARRIEQGAANRCTHGVVIKPNQAGSVTRVRRAVEAAQRCGQIPFTSHRSISTEETFISTLTCLYHVKYMKIGPLMTDYSSVLRLNAMLRLVEQGVCCPERNS